MASSPVGDIVMDVMRAADPEAARAARARLQAFATQNGDGGRFAAMEAMPRLPGARPDWAVNAAPDTSRSDTHVQFEAMVLQSFVEAMLPDDSESVFGSGMAGDIWKSMMAEQLATTMARRGGIGLADRVLGDHYLQDGEKVALRGVDNDPARADREALRLRNESVIHEIQRKLVDDMAAGHDGAVASTRKS